MVRKLPFSKGFFSYVHLGGRSFGGATNRRAGTAIPDLGERHAFRGVTNKMAVAAIADLGERHGFRVAANKSAVTAPLNEHMKKAFRKW